MDSDPRAIFSGCGAWSRASSAAVADELGATERYMASTVDFRNGLVLSIDGQLWQIVYFQHVKPGKGGAFVRTKLKNVIVGNVVERTYRAGEKVNEVRLNRRPVTYSYTDGDLYYFMDAQSFEMIPIAADVI